MVMAKREKGKEREGKQKQENEVKKRCQLDNET
jgi:hypothetical protein